MAIHMTNSGTINLTDAKEALCRSGYLLEFRVERALERCGYYVEANTVFPDPITSKSRELDLFAMGGAKVSRRDDFIFPILLVECVNNPQPLVMFTKNPVTRFLYHHDFKLSGLPVKVQSRNRRDEWISLTEFLHLEKYHHYCRNRVATQFCSFTRKSSSSEWLAQHDTPHFEVFQKLCDAVRYYRDDHFRSWRPGPEEPINLQLYYPLLILQGELLDGHGPRLGVTLRKSSHLQYRRTVIEQQEREEYQIDVITEGELPQFLSLVAGEMDAMKRRIKRHRRVLGEDIKAIVRKAKRLRSREGVRAAMDF
jgi:hypothetical protein